MSMGKSNLRQARILVLEDDYYLATDLQNALEAAVASVVGPFADAAGAVEALAAEPPDCALVDLNLGQGMCFDVPHELARRVIPFAFVTGYDRTAIPDEFAATARVEKPVAAQQAAKIAEQLMTAHRT
jgi:DNA-binding NtrC family response regulator